VARGKSQNDQTPTISFNLNFGHELLILNPEAKSRTLRSAATGYPRLDSNQE